MKYVAQIERADVERGEFQLTLFACSPIAFLAAGLALLMYPIVFADRALSPNRTPQIAFFGFCGRSSLDVAYVVVRQFAIQGLRHLIAIDRMRALESLKQVSADLLGTMPNVNAFEDRLSIEFRRALTAELTLSVLVIGVKLRPDFSDPSFALSALGDAAKAVSRKLHDQESVYVLRPDFSGSVLPGASTSTGRRVSSHSSESLSVAAGAIDRFSFEIDAINYPEQASSSQDLELAVCGYQPEGDPQRCLMSDIPGCR